MKTKKKNRFFTFCFSLIPGAAEMYMGFMKTGLSLMLVFISIILLGVLMNQGVIAVFAVVVWFYSFFHANHLASLNDDEFNQVKDEYLFGMDSLPGIEGFVRKHSQWVAYVLIFVGVCLLWDSLISLLYYLLPDEYNFIFRMMRRIGSYVPSIIIGIGIVLLGVKMISGKKLEGRVVEEKQADAEEKEQIVYDIDTHEEDK